MCICWLLHKYKTPLAARARNTVNCTVSCATAALLANSERNQPQSIRLPVRTVAAVKPTCEYTVQLVHAIRILISNPFSYVSDFQFHTLFKVAHTAVPAPWLHTGVSVSAVLPTVQMRYWIGDVPTEALTPWRSKLLTS